MSWVKQREIVFYKRNCWKRTSNKTKIRFIWLNELLLFWKCFKILLITPKLCRALGKKLQYATICFYNIDHSFISGYFRTKKSNNIQWVILFTVLSHGREHPNLPTEVQGLLRKSPVIFGLARTNIPRFSGKPSN